MRILNHPIFTTTVTLYDPSTGETRDLIFTAPARSEYDADQHAARRALDLNPGVLVGAVTSSAKNLHTA